MVKKNGFTKVYPNVWGSSIIDDAKTSRLNGHIWNTNM
jgi:hypothetical protein